MLTKVVTPDGARRLEHVERADDVGLEGLAGVPFEHREVLERGGVEDDLGLGALEDPAQALGVADVAQGQVIGVEQGLAVDRQLGAVQPALVAVEHHQGRRAEPADLAAQLGADRPARTGDEHSLAGELVGDGPHVEVDRLAAQEVCDVEGAQVGCRRCGRRTAR
jgi:hypothetical protein